MNDCEIQTTPLHLNRGQEPAIAVSGLRHSYRRRGHKIALNALDDLTFDVQAGQFVCILGPNGSGKSTLISVLCGLIRPHAGSFTILGASSQQKIRQSIGVVFQRPSLDGDASVFENLRDHGVLYGLDPAMSRQRIKNELEQAGLTSVCHQLVHVLSAGQQRRVDLIRASMHQPRLLLLDEPTVGLDPNARSTYLEQLEEQRRKQQRTILMSTHLIDEANAADRIIFMNKGQIIADASPSKLRQSVGQRLITVNDPSWKADQWNGPGQFSKTSTGWRMPLKESEAQSITAALVGMGVSFSLAPPTLDDAFQKLTGQQLTDQSLSEPTNESGTLPERVS